MTSNNDESKWEDSLCLFLVTTGSGRLESSVSSRLFVGKACLCDLIETLNERMAFVIVPNSFIIWWTNLNENFSFGCYSQSHTHVTCLISLDFFTTPNPKYVIWLRLGFCFLANLSYTVHNTHSIGFYSNYLRITHFIHHQHSAYAESTYIGFDYWQLLFILPSFSSFIFIFILILLEIQY